MSTIHMDHLPVSTQNPSMGSEKPSRQIGSNFFSSEELKGCLLASATQGKTETFTAVLKFGNASDLYDKDKELQGKVANLFQRAQIKAQLYTKPEKKEWPSESVKERCLNLQVNLTNAILSGDREQAELLIKNNKADLTTLCEVDVSFYPWLFACTATMWTNNWK